MFLNFKGIDWVSHPLDLGKTENLTPFYLGINPRGLVPCLVHDGQVHIESNDIILHLERSFPEPPLIPVGRALQIEQLLKHEDDLHLDMRSVTFRFIFPRTPAPRMSSDALARYAATGSGTVQGKKDLQKEREISYWEAFEANGISDEAVRQSVYRLQGAFADLDTTLATSAYIDGAALSVVDIAWFVYVHRLNLAGYPFSRLHTSVSEWYRRLAHLPQIDRELVLPRDLDELISAGQSQRSGSQSLEAICGL
jgi:glutathione S-transferase